MLRCVLFIHTGDLGTGIETCHALLSTGHEDEAEIIHPPITPANSSFIVNTASTREKERNTRRYFLVGSGRVVLEYLQSMTVFLL